jgi:hypothetical protein
MALSPMRLVRIPKRSITLVVFEPKSLDAFGGLAHVTGHHCALVSRKGHVFMSSPRMRSRDLMFRRESPYFRVFTVADRRELFEARAIVAEASWARSHRNCA